MERLTSDNPKNNIGNALNLFYIKDDWTWVRGGGPAPDYADISLTDFVRMLVRSNIPDNPELPADDDDLSAMMAEWLMDEPDTAEGIIALIYTAGWAFAELRHRLAAYEDTGLEPEEVEIMRESKADAQFMLTELCRLCDYDRLEELARAEQEGRLVVLPCKVGQTVWLLQQKCKHSGEQNKPWDSCNQYWSNVRSKGMWGCAGKDSDGNTFPCEKKEMVRYAHEAEYSLVLYAPHIVLGKNLFLTKEEAEAALKAEGDA